MPTVLVTGGAGFIGSHLCERLLEQGHKVVCFDNFETGKFQNIAHLQRSPKFHIVIDDVREEMTENCDVIFNLACPASPVQYQRNPIGTMKTCVIGTINQLELARRNRVRFIQASTSEVYGNPSIGGHPQTEGYNGNVNPLGIRACYDEGKRAAETLCMDYMRQFQIDVGIVRIFNTYGPRMAIDDGRVVSNFIVQALRGEPLTVFGEGGQTRSFCYVDDTVDALVRMMEATSVIGPINVGNPNEITIMELACTIIEILNNCLADEGKEYFVRTTGTRPEDEPTRRCPDIMRARAWLKWEPQTGLEEGLRKTICYFMEVINAIV